MQAYLLGGRAFGSAATQPTIAQSGYVMGVLRKHQIDRVINADGDVIGAVMEAGCASALVAGLLTEDRKPWTREDAVKNAAYFDGLTDPASHTQFWEALAILLSDFFVPGGSSSTASPTSLPRHPRKESSGRKSRRPATTPASATATGSTSSPSSVSEPAGA